MRKIPPMVGMTKKLGMTKNLCLSVLCSICVICVPFISATAQRLTLDDCIRYAQTNSPDAQQRILQTRHDEAQLTQLRQSQWPTANGSYSQGLNLGRNTDPFTNAFVQQTIHSGNLSAGVNWNVFNGFRTVGQIRQTEQTILADQSEIAQQKFDLTIQVMLGYMQVLQQEAFINIANDALLLVRQQRQRTQELVKEGLLAQTALTDVDAQVASANLDLITTRNNQTLARLALEALLNWRGPQPLTIEPVALPDEKAVTSASDNPESDKSDLWRRASPTQPGLRAATFRLRAAEAGVEVAKAGRYPSLSLGAGFGTAYSSIAAREQFQFWNQLYLNLGQYVRATVAFPIYDGGQFRYQTTLARLNRQRADVQLQRERQRLRQALDQAGAASGIASETLANSRIVVESRKAAYQAAVARYAEGLLPTIDLEVYRNNWLKAQTDLVRVSYEARFRKLVLDLYRQ